MRARDHDHPKAALTATLLALALALPTGALAQPGYFDTTFAGDGTVVLPLGPQLHFNAIAIQPDDKIVVGGLAFSGLLFLARYDPSGALDPSFGAGGTFALPLPVVQVVITRVIAQSNGKILAGGRILRLNGSGGFLLARFDAAGALDPSFGSGGITITNFAGTSLARSIDSLRDLAILPDERIVAVGTSNIGGKFDFALARYLPDGTLDPTFGAGGLMIASASTTSDSAFA